jgi:deazaflavin-dependent oxidoreductase (nitroreductase family)
MHTTEPAAAARDGRSHWPMVREAHHEPDPALGQGAGPRLQRPGSDDSRQQEWAEASDSGRLLRGQGRRLAGRRFGCRRPEGPGLYHNIAAHPDQVEIETAGRRVDVVAEQLHGTEREEAWRQITATVPRFAKYEKKTDRELPIIRLAPRSG